MIGLALTVASTALGLWKQKSQSAYDKVITAYNVQQIENAKERIKFEHSINLTKQYMTQRESIAEARVRGAVNGYVGGSMNNFINYNERIASNELTDSALQTKMELDAMDDKRYSYEYEQALRRKSNNMNYLATILGGATKLLGYTKPSISSQEEDKYLDISLWR